MATPAPARPAGGGARKKGKGGGGRTFGRVLLLVLAFFFSFGVGLAYASWSLVCNAGRCPAVDVLEDYTPRQTSKLFAADGRFMAEIGSEKRTVAKLKDIPPVVRDAFIATEDKRFYEHDGIDWVRVPGSAIARFAARSVPTTPRIADTSSSSPSVWTTGVNEWPAPATRMPWPR